MKVLSGLLILLGVSACPTSSDTGDTATALDTGDTGEETCEEEEVCHVPPGNPDNAHTICISASALDAHIAHGDYLGACEEGDTGDTGDTSAL